MGRRRRSRYQSAALKLCSRGHWDGTRYNEEPPKLRLDRHSARPGRPVPPRLARQAPRPTGTPCAVTRSRPSAASTSTENTASTNDEVEHARDLVER